MKFLFIILPSLFLLVACSISKDHELIEKFEEKNNLFQEIASKIKDCENRYGLDAQTKIKDRSCKTITEELNIKYISTRSWQYYFTIKSSFNYSKGYVYSRKKPKPLFNSLDVIPNNLALGEYGYKHLNKNWYIFIANYND